MKKKQDESWHPTLHSRQTRMRSFEKDRGDHRRDSARGVGGDDAESSGDSPLRYLLQGVSTESPTNHEAFATMEILLMDQGNHSQASK